ncbi:MAG: hypothetical protein KAR35_09485 [Candidatus Heimdallarchaeota archaeon]|nr:hypothetical protein [Candidatus Heimdallarchaeota archaeon]MCK5049588.1 hypothetical protein [Candidatus Heimdallarchaeota archaeon]
MSNKKQTRIKFAYAMTTPIILSLGGGLGGWFLAEQINPGSNLTQALMLFFGVLIGFTIAVLDILYNPYLNPPPSTEEDEEQNDQVQQFIQKEIAKIDKEEGANSE